MRKGWDGEEKCSKGDRMYLTFHILTLKKYLTNNFALYFWDTHIFAPKRDLSPKMSTQVLPLTPFLYCRILLYSYKPVKQGGCDSFVDRLENKSYNS